MSATASDTTLSTYTALDGDNLAVQDWPLPDDALSRGTVVIVHGLGEHAWRYNHVARRLNGWGFAVRGYDHHGHGDSAGARGTLPSPMRLVDDLADLIDSTRLRMRSGEPLIVLGHSMGGLVAAVLVALREPKMEGLVLSSPALDAGLSAFQRLLVSILPRIAPNLTVGNGLNADFISHDPQVVEAYKGDPRVHDRISGRLAKFIADGGRWVIDGAAQWRVPTLLMYAGADHLVNPAGSRAFAAVAPGEVLTVHCFDELFHEIFNEAESDPVFEALRQWLDERFP